ncbi:MAG: oxygen-dependent coproporphyrinogen oxidase [Pseudomonadota bacterium]
MTNTDNCDFDAVTAYLRSLQDTICNAFSAFERNSFQQDEWSHPTGGGGRTRILENGECIEKGGINFSHVRGDQLPASASAKRPEIAGKPFEATGLSLVIHPKNPHAPTAHMNVRFFIANRHGSNPVWWFGGGFDLTPYYGYEADCVHWHTVARQACEGAVGISYGSLKKLCDEYFFIRHRNEPRGIGGLFFDDYRADGFRNAFGFMQRVGDHFLPAYLPIIERRKNTEYSQQQIDFQNYRRGRYVEFNLVQDRGTLFGLQSGGRTESILMSLPPTVNWRYDWRAAPDSAEARLTDYFLQSRNWLDDRAKDRCSEQ